MSWINRAFSEGDGSPSAKRLFYGVAVASGILAAAVDMATHRGLRAESIELFKAVIYVTGGAYVGGRFAETKEEPKDDR